MAWPSLLCWKKEKQTGQINNLKPQLQSKIRFKSAKGCKDPSNYFVSIYCWLPLSFQTSCYSGSRDTRIYMEKNYKVLQDDLVQLKFASSWDKKQSNKNKSSQFFKKINGPTQLWNSDLGTDFGYCKCLGFAIKPHCSLLLKQNSHETLTQSIRLPSLSWATEFLQALADQDTRVLHFVPPILS